MAPSSRAPAKKTAPKKATTKTTAAATTKRKPAAKKAANTTPAKAAAAQKKPVKKAAAKPAVKADASAKALCKQIAGVIDLNKGEEIITLDLIGKCSFADYMIVASGRAPRHVSALADYVADTIKKSGAPVLSIEGKESGDWVLIDAGDIVVHIFRPEVRQFYNLEKMWAMPIADY